MLKPKSKENKTTTTKDKDNTVNTVNTTAKYFRFHSDTGVSGVVKADSFEEAEALMKRISLDPIHERKGFSFDDADVKYPQITVVRIAQPK